MKYWALEHGERANFSFIEPKGILIGPIAWRLRTQCSPEEVGWPDPPPVYRASCPLKRGVTDYPSLVRPSEVVSDRLRLFLEVEAPGCCEFVRVLVQDESGRDTGVYWAIKWPRTIDCLAEESFDKDENGEYVLYDHGDRRVQYPIIDVHRIPARDQIGIIRGYEPMVLISNDLRLKLKKAGFTGLRFDRIAVYDDPDRIPFNPPDRSRPKGEIPLIPKVARHGRVTKKKTKKKS